MQRGKSHYKVKPPEQIAFLINTQNDMRDINIFVNVFVCDTDISYKENIDFINHEVQC